MFRELGIKLDELVYKLKQWHYSNWYYKIYIYIKTKSFIKQDKFVSYEHFERMMMMIYNKQVYNSHFNKLLELYYKGDKEQISNLINKCRRYR